MVITSTQQQAMRYIDMQKHDNNQLGHLNWG